MIEKMLSLKELRYKMNLSEATFYRLKKKNVPPFNMLILVLGRKVLPESALFEWERSLIKTQALNTCEG
jgi:predicted DNA-binding transcriptional regulator AlpA